MCYVIYLRCQDMVSVWRNKSNLEVLCLQRSIKTHWKVNAKFRVHVFTANCILVKALHLYLFILLKCLLDTSLIFIWRKKIAKCVDVSCCQIIKAAFYRRALKCIQLHCSRRQKEKRLTWLCKEMTYITLFLLMLQTPIYQFLREIGHSDNVIFRREIHCIWMWNVSAEATNTSSQEFALVASVLW